MIDTLLANNKEICKQIEEISRFTVYAIEKLDKKPKDEEEKKDP
jgi:hypothetical protein